MNELLTKYCKFLPIEIISGKKKEWKDGEYKDTTEDNVINDTNPAWTRKPADLTEEDYEKFYHELYPMAQDPLFHIHLNVDCLLYTSPGSSIVLHFFHEDILTYIYHFIIFLCCIWHTLFII